MSSSLPLLARIVETLDSAIQRINHYPLDKYHAETNCFIHLGVIALSTFWATGAWSLSRQKNQNYPELCLQVEYDASYCSWWSITPFGDPGGLISSLWANFTFFLLFCPLFSLLVPCVRIFSQKPQEVRIYTLAVEEEQIKFVTGLGQKFIQPRSQPVSKIDVCFFF